MQSSQINTPRFNFFPGERDVFKPRPRVRTFSWTAKSLRVVSGPHKGQYWKPNILPYARKVMDTWDRPSVRKIFIIAPSQSGKTTIAYACLFGALVKRPGPAGVAMPDQDAVERIFEEKLTKHIRSSPKLRRKLARDRYAVQKDALRFQDGTVISGIWAGSESRMSSVSIEYLLIDEEDAYPNRGAVGTIEERVTAYPYTHKVMRFSKVRGAEGESIIWDDMHSQSDVIYHFEAKCPNCLQLQQMDFRQIKVPEGERDPGRILSQHLATYECEHCQTHWDNHNRIKALRGGKWVANREVSNPATVGFQLRSWELPFVSLSKVMHDWFDAQGDPDKMQRFDNNHQAKPYEPVQTYTQAEQLQEKVDPDLPRDVVPEQAAALTLSADMQMDHFYWSVWAHAVEPLRDWVVAYGIVQTFEDLEQLIYKTQWKTSEGRALAIWRAALDTGGGRAAWQSESRTQQAYRWLLKQRQGLIYGTKGMSRSTPGVHVKLGEPLQKFPNGKRMPGALRLYQIDTDVFKDLLFWRFSEESTEPLTFHAETELRYLRQLTAEKKVLTKQRKEVWKQIRPDNHWLDCAVGHLAMIHWQWEPNLQRAAQMKKTARNEAKSKAKAQEKKTGRPNPRAGGKPNWFNNR